MMNPVWDYHDIANDSDSYQAYCLEGPCRTVFPPLGGFFQLGVAAKGEHICTTQKFSHYLGAGDALVLPPADCRTTVELKAGAQMFLIFFRPEALLSLPAGAELQWPLRAVEANAAGGREDGTLRVFLEDDALRDCAVLSECMVHGQRGCRAEHFAQVACGILCSLLDLLFRSRDGGAEDLPCSSQTAGLMRECVAYIDKHFAEPLSPKCLAQRCMMSESNFRVFFSRLTGMPLKKYLTQRRIQEACNLLRNEDHSLQMVGYLVGYEEPSTFYRNFSKLKSMTPAQYRSQYRNAGHGARLKIV